MFEERAEYETWVKIVLALPFVVILATSILIQLYEEDRKALPILLIVIFLITAVYWLILPRKFRITQDSLEIVIGFTYRIPLTEIEKVKKGSSFNIFFRGIKFATSRNFIEIKRKGGLPITISPKNADLFFEQIRVHLRNFRGKDL